MQLIIIKKNQGLATITYILGIGIAVLLSILFKYTGINGIMNVNEMIFIRTLISFLLLTPFSLSEAKEKIKKNSKNEIFYLILVGFFSLIDCYFLNTAITKIPINNVAIILLIGPILNSFLSSVILGEKVSNRIKIAILINLIAMLTLYKLTIHKFNIGYILALIAVISASFLIIFTKKIVNKYSTIGVLYFRLLIMLPFSILFIKDFHFLTKKTLIIGLIFSTLYITERMLFITAYKIAPSISAIQPFKYFNIIFASIFGYIILGEKPALIQFLVFLVVVISAIWSTKNGQR